MNRSIEQAVDDDPDEAVLVADDTGMVRGERDALEPVVVDEADTETEEYETIDDDDDDDVLRDDDDDDDD